MNSEHTSPSDTLLDTSQLETFVILGHDEYTDLLEDVKREVPSYFTTIRAAIVSGDAKTCTAATHSCRGMLSYFGCISLNAILAKLENEALPDQASADSIHHGLVTTWERSLAALEEWEKSVPNFAP